MGVKASPRKNSSNAAKSKPEFTASQASGRPSKAKGELAVANTHKVVAKLARDAAAAAGRRAQPATGATGRPMVIAAGAAGLASRPAQGSTTMVTADKKGGSAKKDSGRMNGGKTSGKSGGAAAPKAHNSRVVVEAAGSRSSTEGGQAATRRNGAKAGEAGASSVSLPSGYRPSDNEPFMNERQRLYFRNKLIAWKEEIVRLNRETLNGLHEDSAQHADVADRATFETDRALELRARDRQRKLISKIDAALARLEEGSYGYCEETGEPIGLKRLDARPIATLSIEAQERHERRERVFREE